MNQVHEIIMLLHDDWRPYNNQPEKFVYETLKCKEYTRIRPSWFYKGEKFICLGCKNKCSLFRPVGFQTPLPINYPRQAEDFKYSTKELVQRKSSLTVDETAYCLNISKSQVYKWVYEGKLTALNQKPVRVLSEDVKRLMQDYDE